MEESVLNEFMQDHPEYKEEIIERCGIKEFSGNIPRKFAEEQTVKLLKKKYDLYKQVEMF